MPLASLGTKWKGGFLRELAEFRCVHYAKRLQIRQDLVIDAITKERNRTTRKLNKDIRQLRKQQQDAQQPRDQPFRIRVLLGGGKRDRANSTPLPAPRSPSPSSRSPSPSSVSGPSGLSRRLTKPRAATVSLPLNRESDMKEFMTKPSSFKLRQPVAVDISVDKSLFKALALNPLPGLAEDDDIIDDDTIPAAVLNRGRRMSRSATSMRDLVQQEISYYIDNKKEQLPTLPLSELSTKNKLSYSIEAIVSPATKTPVSAQTVYLSSSADETPDHSPQRISPVTLSRPVSASVSESQSRSRTSSLPSPRPPSMPKPPNSTRPLRNIGKRSLTAARKLT